ncbi:hypothetical protein F443_17888 [Phytophthora nicotianae P1569]|uniref:Fe2OG dioxygenase domain-containing protein n=1 Tax=Phytophthora nicotianae P1569 TaxID=1317065 RepID=V9E9S8_PHYNI|nr:hypothetical protein F443_17888 [Phytophthora nicotianae P1569]
MESLLRMAASAGPPQREQEKDFEKGKWPFGSQGTPDTVPIPSGDGCVRISEVLGRADKQAGEYSFGGKADALPAAPGICIEDVGPISIPLGEHDAVKLIAKCKKSPFGHNFETKMDDNVRKSWQLEPSQVEFKNPLWERGLNELTRTITERLGYTGVWLQCVLYKLLVYEEGGHFAKHQDTEKEDGMVATLVVQLPSLHEGGDLVIYSNGEVKHRHDFGKADGTAAFMPHYAVHYADAEHSLEKVTKGFRLALVYSICLPKDKSDLKRVSDKPLSDGLVDAIRMVSDRGESFALLLSHEYTKKSIADFGCEALKGVDRVRFGALEEANTLVATDKKLNFYIAELSLFVEYSEHDDEAGWFECEREQSITWYNYLPDINDIGQVQKTEAVFNFLNPAGETLTQLWMPHGTKEFHCYTGNEGPSSSTKYSRYTIVAWPASRHAENALSYFPMDLAYEALNARKPFDASALRSLMEQVDKRFETERDFSIPLGFSIEFCRLFCELVLDAGDPELVNFFFTKLCPKLGNIGGNDTLVPFLVAIIRKFEWSNIGLALLSSLSKSQGYYSWNQTKQNELSFVELTLRVLDALDGDEGQEALLQMALEKAMELKDEQFCSPKLAPLLCKWSRRSSDDSRFKAFSEKLNELDPRFLGPVIEGISQLLVDEDKTGELYVSLKALAPKRIEWLNDQISELSKSFTWEMPDAEFRGSKVVKEFLRGPDESMDMKDDFTNLEDVRDYAAQWTEKDQRGASFKLEAAGSDEDPYLKITKTRKWFEDRQKTLEQYKKEVGDLMERFDEKTDEGLKKRARHQ